MQTLDEERLRENTLVLFTSDNGPEYPVNFLESQGQWDDPLRDRCFGTPGDLRGMKRFTHEGGHRVPGIIRWPRNIPAGAESDVLINGTDLLPTLCELAGISIPKDRNIDGESVTSALKGKPFSRKKPVYWNAPVHEYEFVPSMTMREKNYILVAWFNDKAPDELWMDWIKTALPERYELYDLSRDIGQTEDLSEQMPHKVKELAAKMEVLWKDIQTEAPIWPEWKAK
jgi:arylsulfatase A